MSADDLPLQVAWFENQGNKGQPALGDPEDTTWDHFTSIFAWRREGEKDGCNFIPARFKLEPDGRQVRRLKGNLLARTAITLDVETNKATGESPPSLDEAMNRARAHGLGALGYTSHNNGPGNLRYRLVLPLSGEIPHELPAPEVMAEHLGLLGVLDMSKTGAASLFFLPSCPYGTLDLHQTVVITGAPVVAGWMVEQAGALQAVRQQEADHSAATAQTEAAARRAKKLADGFDPDDSLIEKLRTRFDLDEVLRSHGYDKVGENYRHPNSESGSYGADIKVFGGIERVFSHNGTDPLHANNLPGWCDVKAIDAFDATVILDFGCDRTRAMRELAEQFKLTKSAETKAVAAVMFRMIRSYASDEEIQQEAFAEGARQGLSKDEVLRVAAWVTANREAA
jgi:hypothetical protein